MLCFRDMIKGVLLHGFSLYFPNCMVAGYLIWLVKCRCLWCLRRWILEFGTLLVNFCVSDFGLDFVFIVCLFWWLIYLFCFCLWLFLIVCVWAPFMLWFVD